MRSPLFLALALLSLSGCANVCDRMCDAKVELYESCLPEWGTTWEEEGYADADAYLDRCLSVWGDAYDQTDKDSSERQELSQECTSTLGLAQSDTDCQTLLE